MDKDIDVVIEGKDIQLYDWMILEYSAIPRSRSGMEETGVSVEPGVIDHADNFYILDLNLTINPPSEEEESFAYKCRASAKFIVLDGFDGGDHEARASILTDGACELYTLVKGYVFMMTGNSETMPLALPSVVFYPSNDEAK